MQNDRTDHVELGVITTLPSTLKAVETAQAAERHGFDRVGVSDTAPLMYHACYPAVTAILLQTERIGVGPYVSNPVSRHWSVHLSTAKAFEEIAPGRFFLGMATGDGAVHSVGLNPASRAYFRQFLEEMRPHFPAPVPIHMSFSGVKGLELAGELASEITIGTGMDVGALRELARRARAARAKAGVEQPLKVWASAAVYFAPSEAAIPDLRTAVSGLACHGARFAFDFSFEGKCVPEAYQPVIREGMQRYDFAYHGKFGDNPNGHIFDDHPDVKNHIIDRFALIGTPEQCAARLESIVREAGLDGVWLMLYPLPPEEGGADRTMEIAAQAFTPIRHIQR